MVKVERKEEMRGKKGNKKTTKINQNAKDERR